MQAAVLEREISQYELERGKPAPDFLHGVIQANISFELFEATNDQFTLACEVTLDTDEPLGSTPDVLVFPKQKLDYRNVPDRCPQAPLLTIEIQNPSQSQEEMESRVFTYFEFGVQSAWVVMPALRAIFVYDRTGMYEVFHHEEILQDKTLGIELPLAKIFA